MRDIPENEIEYKFSRSSGKGGQNGNKTETRVQLRWWPGKSAILSNEEKYIVGLNLKNRLLSDGSIIVVSSSERSQLANIRRARHNMAFLLQNALKRSKKRLKTHPTRASRLKRLENKRKISMKKINRKINDY